MAKRIVERKSMKKHLILSLAVLVVAGFGCSTYNKVPYTPRGVYGFTYDLDHQRSPFTDTSYRPLTVRDLSQPIVLTRTNQVTLNLSGPDPVAPRVNY